MSKSKITITIDKSPIGYVMEIKAGGKKYRFQPYATNEDALVAAEAWVRANPEVCK